MSKPKLSEIEVRAEGATEGCWVNIWPDDPDQVWIMGACTGPGCHDDPWAHGDVLRIDMGEVVHDLSRTDADFIAAARTDVPALTAAIRGVLADLTELTRIAMDDDDPNADGKVSGWQQGVDRRIRATLAAHLDLS